MEEYVSVKATTTGKFARTAGCFVYKLARNHAKLSYMFGIKLHRTDGFKSIIGDKIPAALVPAI